MRLLITGDLHLGRRSTRIPDHIPEAAAADAWRRAVDVAIAHDVDAVLLSGDLIDQDNRYFEALGPLETQLRRLRSAGIRAVAVAGNHDHATLPALAATLPADMLTLLGTGGRWEQITLTSHRDASRLHVLGWSFPTRTVRESPLSSLPPIGSDGPPTIGLVHGDLDVSASAYAPLASSELSRAPVCAWVLGHIHAGGLRAHAPPVLYPGSPQPLDPGEAGAHGVWLADIAGDGAWSVRLLPLASVQYDTVPVDLGGCRDWAAVRARVVQALRDAVARTQRDGLHHLAVRVQLVGRSPLHGQLEPLAQQLCEAQSLVLDAEAEVLEPTFARDAHATSGQSVSVTHVHDGTTPDHDLEALASGTDAIGLLAQWRRALEVGGLDALPESLRAAVCRVPADVAGARVFAGVIEATLPNEALTDLLRTQVDRLLDALLAQRHTTESERAS